MENNIKQAVDQIDVPVEKLDVAIQAGVYTQTKKKNTLKKVGLACVAASAMIISSGFVSPKVADVLANVPILGVIYEIEREDKGLQIALLDENKVMLNEIVTSSGISVTFEEIVYDGERLHVIFSMDEYQDIWPLTILVDGNVVNNGERLIELESDTGFKGLWKINIEEELPEQFDLTLQINYINGVAGDWQISTPIKKVHNAEQTFTAGQQGQMGDIRFEVMHVAASQTYTTIAVKMNISMEEQFKRNQMIFSTLTDETGLPLKLVDQKMSMDGEALLYTIIYEPLDNEVDTLHFNLFEVPTIVETRIEIKEPLQDVLSKPISFGEIGEMVITTVREEGAETTLLFEIDSSFTFDYAFTQGNVTITDEHGESIVTDYMHAVGPNQYELSYQNNVGKPYIEMIMLPKIEVDEAAKITIPLK